MPSLSHSRRWVLFPPLLIPSTLIVLIVMGEATSLSAQSAGSSPAAQSTAPPPLAACLLDTGASAPAFTGTVERATDGKSPPRRAGVSNILGIPNSGCYVQVTIDDPSALPARNASAGWRLLVQPQHNTTLLRIELRDSAKEFLRASDVPAADQQLGVPVLAKKFDGRLEIRRADLRPDGASPPAVRVALIGEPLDGVANDPDAKRIDNRDLVFLNSLATSGQAFKTDLKAKQYRDLASLAVDYRDRAATVERKRDAYQLISELVGRRIETKTIDFASRTEPIVAFIGIAGLSRLVLIDCQAWPMTGADTSSDSVDCERISEPWQTTLERATHFWVAYIEDEQSAFDTSIDVEFGRMEQREYDDFDAQNVLRLLDAEKKDPKTDDKSIRRVRVGYRRFALPTRMDAAKVTISRQGSSYGLRSWSRSYDCYGRNWYRLTAGIAVPGWYFSRKTLGLKNVYGVDPINPTAVEAVESSNWQPVYAMVFFRTPQLRTAAEQSDRSWRSFVPDVGAGIALPWIDDNQSGLSVWEKVKAQTLLTVFSWPLTFGDRIHFLAGWLRSKEVVNPPPPGQRFPVGTMLDDVREVRVRWRGIVGISVDLARTP